MNSLDALHRVLLAHTLTDGDPWDLLWGQDVDHVQEELLVRRVVPGDGHFGDCSVFWLCFGVCERLRGFWVGSRVRVGGFWSEQIREWWKFLALVAGRMKGLSEVK